jgi:hypothetical protein
VDDPIIYPAFPRTKAKATGIMYHSGVVTPRMDLLWEARN